MPKVYVVCNPNAIGGDDDDGEEWSCRNWTEFCCCSFLLWVLALTLLALIIYWVAGCREGFGWGGEGGKKGLDSGGGLFEGIAGGYETETKPTFSNKLYNYGGNKLDDDFGYSGDDEKKRFNFHPFLMIFSFIILESIAMSLYRVCRCARRIYLKLIHFLLHLLVIPCVVVAYIAVDKYSSKEGNKRKFSAHSWIGLLAVACFCLQLIIGFFTFLMLICCNRATGEFRADMVPLHAAFGILTFAVSVTAVATGIQEKLFKEKEGNGEGVEDKEILVARIILMVMFAIFFILHYMLRREELRYRAHLPNLHSGEH